MADSVPDFPMPEVVSERRRAEGRIAVGDRAEVRLRPGLLRFLMTGRGPAGERPGRRVHPMTGLPLGIAIEAAILAAGGKSTGLTVLKACEVTFTAPIDAEDVVLATGEIVSLGRRHVRASILVRREEDNLPILRGEVVLVAVEDGRAVNVTHLHAAAE